MLLQRTVLIISALVALCPLECAAQVYPAESAPAFTETMQEGGLTEVSDSVNFNDYSSDQKKRSDKTGTASTVQDRRFWVGPRVAVGFSNQYFSSGDYSDNMDTGISFSGGFVFGYFFNKNPSLRIGAELGVQLAMLAAKNKESKTNMSLSYIQIPLNVVLNLPFSKAFSWDFSTGFYTGFGFESSMVVDGTGYDVDLFKDSYEKLDYGIQIGTGIRIKAVYLGFSYAAGLANIARTNNYSSDYKATNSNASIILGCNF